MQSPHTIRQVRELRSRIVFLRALRPDNPSYRLWIGDIAELANTVWGIGAAEPLQLAAALHSSPDEAAGAGQEDLYYLERLGRIDAVLESYERVLASMELGGGS